MATLKAKDLRSLSTDELNDKAETLRKNLFQLRLEAKLAKLENLMRLNQTRKDLAKVLTVKREMELPPALRAATGSTSRMARRDRPGGKHNG